ncbi:hypothetical protein K491DRAFT_577729, partial [Lophiostoma macrostomum CBS 122681]
TTPPNDVTGTHSNGHLVETGMYKEDGVLRLFIYDSGTAIPRHFCTVYSYNPVRQKIDFGERRQSPDFVVEEHGWSGDPNTFHQQCMNNHPIPNGQISAQQVFINWRDAVLTTLNDPRNGP